MQTSLTRSWQTSQAQISQDSQAPQVSAKISKMLKALFLGAFVACVAQAQNLDAEIERLEKQKKILELKRQNNQLQKELDRTGTRSNPQNSAPNNYPSNYQNNTQGNYQGNYPNNYPNQKSKQNYPKGNQPQYYGPPAQNQQQNKARYYYEEEEDDEEVIYTSKKDTDTQFYIRLEGGAYAGGWLRVAPLAGLELGVKFNDNGRLFLGSSYAWGKGNQFIVDGYVGVGWIPRFFDSPVRFVLDSYIGGSYGEWNDTYDKNNCSSTSKSIYDAITDAVIGSMFDNKKDTCKPQYVAYKAKGGGFLAGLRTGLAFDIGRHTWLEFGCRLDVTVGSLNNLYTVGYGSFSVLF